MSTLRPALRLCSTVFHVLFCTEFNCIRSPKKLFQKVGNWPKKLLVAQVLEFIDVFFCFALPSCKTPQMSLLIAQKSGLLVDFTTGPTAISTQNSLGWCFALHPPEDCSGWKLRIDPPFRGLGISIFIDSFRIHFPALVCYSWSQSVFHERVSLPKLKLTKNCPWKVTETTQ